MAEPEQIARDSEARRAREVKPRNRLLQRIGEAVAALLLFGGVLYWATWNGSPLLSLIAVLAGSFGYLILRRLWSLEDRLEDLEGNPRRRDGI
ncbi:MAG: hypothetical protein C0518_13110 [Opitutus sp.]|nr:hypothetical protein [Opitutus sp.]